MRAEWRSGSWVGIVVQCRAAVKPQMSQMSADAVTLWLGRRRPAAAPAYLATLRDRQFCDFQDVCQPGRFAFLVFHSLAAMDAASTSLAKGAGLQPAPPIDRDQRTFVLIGAGMEVHRVLGPRLLEI